MTQTTCQICGRKIQATKGLIAHHGYTRPGNGWQTGSCFGARNLPYEVSRNVIPDAQRIVKDTIDRRNNQLRSLLDTPPAIINEEVRVRIPGSLLRKTETREHARPDNFSATENFGATRYAQIYQRDVFKLEREIATLLQEQIYLQERFDNWVPPAGSK